MGSTGNTGRRDTIASVVVAILGLYFVVAALAFQWRHPALNEAQFFRYLPQALLFQTVELPDTGAREGGR